MSIAKLAAVKSPGHKLFSSKLAAIVVWTITIFWSIPTLGVLITSFRKKEDIVSSGWWNVFLHPNFSLDNYKAIFATGTDTNLSNGLGPYIINSLVITIPAVIFPIAIATLAAYGLAWIKFKGSEFLYYLIVVLQIVPIQLALIPLLQLFSHGAHIGTVTIFPYLHIVNTFVAVWIPHTMFALPLGIFLLHNSISALPRELMEAAVVDGADHFKIFRRIVLPLSVPAIASLAIFQFLWVWNDLLVALSFTSGTDAIAPLNAELGNLVGAWGAHWEYMTASVFIDIFVPLIVFFSLKRYFVRGILAGSVK